MTFEEIQISRYLSQLKPMKKIAYTVSAKTDITFQAGQILINVSAPLQRGRYRQTRNDLKSE
jgi:hypothetical protein